MFLWLLQEQLVDNVTDHLAPVFDRLSTYIKLKEDEERGGDAGTNGDASAHEAKVQTHKELQARLAVLTKCLAIMKKNVENPQLAVNPRVGGHGTAVANSASKMARRQSLNSHVTASAAARRAEAAAAMASAANERHTPSVQAKPKPARHSMGATPNRSTSPAATKIERRQSLNSHVTASMASRRAEDKMAHDKAASEAVHTKVTPKRFNQTSSEHSPKPAPAATTPSVGSKGERRLSLNSHVTASAAARRAEDKAVHDKAAAETKPRAQSAGRPLPRVALLAAKPRDPPKEEPAPNPSLGQRRVSLNSHLTASQVARRAEVKDAKTATPNKAVPARARSPHSTPKQPAPFSSKPSVTGSAEKGASATPGSDSKVQRRASLNSQMTASQLARRNEIKQEHASPRKESPAKSPSPSRVPQRSPHVTVTHSPFFGGRAAETQSSETAADSLDGARTASPDTMQRRVSLNSNMTASQAARRAEVKADHRAVRTPVHSPKGAPSPSPQGRGQRGFRDEPTAAERVAKDFVRVGDGSHTTLHAQSGDSTETTVVRVTTPTELFDDVHAVAQRQRSLSKLGLFATIDDASPLTPPEPTTTAGTAHDVQQETTVQAEPVTISAAEQTGNLEEPSVVVDAQDEVALSSGQEVDTAATTASAEHVEPLPEPPVTETAAGTSATADEQSPEPESAAVPPPVPPLDADQHLDSMFAAEALHSQDAEDTPPSATTLVPAVAAAPVELPASEPPVAAQPSVSAPTVAQQAEPTAAAPDAAPEPDTSSAAISAAAASASIVEPERKARREAFERLMKRMNTNKDSKDASPADGSPVDSATAAHSVRSATPPVRQPASTAPTSAAAPAAKSESATTDATPGPKTTTQTAVPAASDTSDSHVVSDTAVGAAEVPTASTTTTAESAAHVSDAAPEAPAAQPTKRGLVIDAVAAEAEAEAAQASPQPSPSTAATAEGDDTAPKGVSALLSKFGQKAGAARPQSGDRSPQPERSQQEVVSPKREKSTRVSELMNKFNSSSKAAPSSPVPANAPAANGTGATGRPSVRASVTSLGDISPIKAVFEKETAEAQPTADVGAGESSEPSAPVVVSQPPTSVAADTAIRESEDPNVVVPPVSTIAEPVAPVTEAEPVVEAPQEPLPSAQVSSQPAAEPQSEPVLLESAANTEPIPEEASIAPATATSGATSGPPLAVETYTSARESTPAEPRTGGDTMTPSSYGFSPSQQSPDAVSPAGDAVSPASEGDDAFGGGESASDAGTETSSKKGRRATFKGVWKRVKSMTGSGKEKPFETEGWKPSAMPVPEATAEEEYDQTSPARSTVQQQQEQDGGADWSTPDVFDGSSPQASGKAFDHDDPTVDTANGDSASGSQRRPTFKGLWKMVKATK
jgi:hypothetical protein